MAAGDGAAELVPNRLLWAARQARLLTQQQLAEAVGAAHWQLFQREAPIDADHVSKLERGMITWPNARYRAAFRTVLGTDTDAELGFYSRRARSTVEVEGLTDSGREVDTVRRNEFIRLITGLGAGAGLGISELAQPGARVMSLAATPMTVGRVGRTEIDQVREATTTFENWLARYGGGACRDALAGQLRWAAGLLRGQIGGSTRRELHSAVGSLADMAGWSDVDAGHHDTALSCFRLALHCADEARDWDLRAEVLSDLAMQAACRSECDDALSLIELAQVRADRVTGTGRVMISSAYARILAIVGRVGDCQSAVSAAEDHFAACQPTSTCSRSTVFRQATETDLAHVNGQALFYAGLRDPAAAPAAVSQLRTALGRTDDTRRRRRAMATAKLATLELLHGDRGEGVDLGYQTLDLVDGMRSARLTDDLRRFRSATTGRTDPVVDALRQQLDSVLQVA